LGKKITVSIVVILVIIVFSYGISVGHYKLFPFEQLKIFKSNFIGESTEAELDEFFIKPDLKSLIHISNEDDVMKKREQLIQYIWKNAGFPASKLPDEVIEDIDDSRMEVFSNLKRVDRLTIIMDYGIKSNAYLFLPNQNNNKLIIYHQGHGGDFFLGNKTIQFFLDKGYSVLAFSMPLLEPNNQPIVEIPEFGKIKLTTHETLKFIESEEFSPISLFVEPIIVGLNYLNEEYEYDLYYMVGISGGGWTTVLVSSIDDRILQSYSVAGSLPMYLRTISGNLGDYEQTIPDFYRIANYLDLYILDSYGKDRKFVQIFNKYDPCCYGGDVSKTYEFEIKETIQGLGKGTFEIFLDESHKEHKISENSLEFIYKSINS